MTATAGTNQTPLTTSGRTFSQERGPYFGAFGGRFVPEALVAALDEIEAAHNAAMADEGFLAELAELHRSYSGRPSILTEVPRFAAHAGGARIILKREGMVAAQGQKPDDQAVRKKLNDLVYESKLKDEMGKVYTELARNAAIDNLLTGGYRESNEEAQLGGLHDTDVKLMSNPSTGVKPTTPPANPPRATGVRTPPAPQLSPAAPKSAAGTK